MSNFSKEELYRLYHVFEPHFTTLAEEANHYGIHLELSISPDGKIEFTSRKYVTEKGKDVVKMHNITQAKNFVQDGSMTVVLHENTTTHL